MESSEVIVNYSLLGISVGGLCLHLGWYPSRYFKKESGNSKLKGNIMRLIQTYRPTNWASSPFSQLTTLSDELNRLFDLPVRGGSRPNDSLQSWMPALDLREDTDAFVASIEVPGMKREQIEVAVHDGVLSIAGERNWPEHPDGAGVYRSERRFGRFQRSVSLPKPVQAGATKAVYRDGVLTVTMPKTEEAKPRQIEVSVS